MTWIRLRCANGSRRPGWRAAARAGSGYGRAPAASLLTARRDAFAPLLPEGGDALRSLDVSLLGAALERLAGIDSEAVAAGAIEYTKSAGEAIERVEPVSTVPTQHSSSSRRRSPSSLAVAAAGDVMPQKSTYFYPKALTGLVINPHEW